MRVELRSDLLTSKFWQSVQQSLTAELKSRGLDEWTVLIRPRTQEDDYFYRDSERYNLTAGEARDIDRNTPDIDVSRETLMITVVVPDSEQFVDPAGFAMTARDLADWLADELPELLDN